MEPIHDSSLLYWNHLMYLPSEKYAVKTIILWETKNISTLFILYHLSQCTHYENETPDW